MKKWKCTICDYIHTGDSPPDVCPLCGVGPELFVELVDNAQPLTEESIKEYSAATIRATLEKVSYGLYVVTSHDTEGKINGQCVNTVIQLTNIEPIRIAVSINKNTLTHEYIMKSGVMAVMILKADDVDSVRRFGFQSGRKVDKFAGTEHLFCSTGAPILTNALAFFEGKVLFDKSTDVGTHTLFVVDVLTGKTACDLDPLTYADYKKKK